MRKKCTFCIFCAFLSKCKLRQVLKHFALSLETRLRVKYSKTGKGLLNCLQYFQFLLNAKIGSTASNFCHLSRCSNLRLLAALPIMATKQFKTEASFLQVRADLQSARRPKCSQDNVLRINGLEIRPFGSSQREKVFKTFFCAHFFRWCASKRKNALLTQGTATQKWVFTRRQFTLGTEKRGAHKLTKQPLRRLYLLTKLSPRHPLLLRKYEPRVFFKSIFILLTSTKVR